MKRFAVYWLIIIRHLTSYLGFEGLQSFSAFFYTTVTPHTTTLGLVNHKHLHYHWCTITVNGSTLPQSRDGKLTPRRTPRRVSPTRKPDTEWGGSTCRTQIVAGAVRSKQAEATQEGVSYVLAMDARTWRELPRGSNHTLDESN